MTITIPHWLIPTAEDLGIFGAGCVVGAICMFLLIVKMMSGWGPKF